MKLLWSLALLGILFVPTALDAANRPKICALDGYLQYGYSMDNQYHQVEWSGRLIGTMVSGAEIGLETVTGTEYPVFDAFLGDKMNIENKFPTADGTSVFRIEGNWHGIDCILYRGIYGFEKYARDGQVCVPLIEATSISIVK